MEAKEGRVVLVVLYISCRLFNESVFWNSGYSGRIPWLTKKGRSFSSFGSRELWEMVGRDPFASW